MGRVWVRTQADAFDKTLHLTDGGGGGDTTEKREAKKLLWAHQEEVAGVKVGNLTRD